jgi:hypothetical protein
MSQSSKRPTTWGLAAAYAATISVFVLLVLYYWYAVADRYAVFLYYHDMGPFVPDTAPFSAVTSSRYWMAGLVVSGAVMLFYALANFLVGRYRAAYRPPGPWRVWVLCALPLAVGIPLLTTTANQPQLPTGNAAQVTLATLMGLALALLPGSMAAEQPRNLAWLVLDGLSLMFVLTSTIGLQYVRRWLATSGTWRLWLMATIFAVGVVGLTVVTGLRIWRRTSIPRAVAVFTAGLCMAYLFMPLMHHLFFTDGYYYITDSDNFFARNAAVQLLTWLIAATLALGVTRLRELVLARRTAAIA